MEWLASEEFNFRTVVGVFDCCANNLSVEDQLGAVDLNPRSSSRHAKHLYAYFACSLGETADYGLEGGQFSAEILAELESQSLTLDLEDVDNKLRSKFERLEQKGQHPVRYYSVTRSGVFEEDYGSRLRRYFEPVNFHDEQTRYLPGFIGREWLYGKVKAWLDDKNGSRVFLVTGDPGVGKTAFSALLCSQPSVIAVHYFCVHGDEQKSDPRRCVMTIAYQLTTRLPEYRERVNGLSLEKIASKGNARTLFKTLIVEPLKDRVPEPDHTGVLLIDGLDEASNGEKNELAELIAAEFRATPAWLRLIITSRPESAVTLPLQGYDPYPLDRTSRFNMADIEDYIDRHFRSFAPNGTVPQTTVKTVAICSEGLFLYLHYVREELALGRLSLNRPAEFPKGLGEVYWRFFNRQFPEISSYQAEIRPVLETVLASKEDPTVQMLAAVFNWSDYERADLNAKLGALFPIREGCVKPFHRSVVEWLTDPERAGRYVVSITEGHRRLANFGWTIYQSGEEMTSLYLLTYLPSHLREADRCDDARQISYDLSFAVTRCAQSLARFVISDYDAVCMSSMTAREPWLEAFIKVCRYSIVFLEGPRNEVISRLELRAFLFGMEDVVQRFRELREDRIYATRWARAQITPHQIVAQGGSADFAIGDIGGSPVIVCADKTAQGDIRLWNARSGEPLGAAMHGHGVEFKGDFAGSVECVAFGKVGDRPFLASGGADRRVKIWDPQRRIELKQSSDLGARVYSVAFAVLNGKPVVFARAGDSLYTLNGSTLTPLAAPFSIGGPIYTGTFGTFANAPIFVGTSDRKKIHIYSLVQGETLFDPIESEGELEWIATAEHRGYLLVSLVVGRKEIQTYSANNRSTSWRSVDTGNETVTALCLGDWDGVPILVAGTYDERVHIWRLDTGMPLVEPLEGHQSTVTNLIVTKIDGVPALLSGSLDGTVRRWAFESSGRAIDRHPLDDSAAVPIATVKGVKAAVFRQIGKVVVCDINTGDDIGPVLSGLATRAIKVAITVTKDKPIIVAGYWNGGQVIGWDAFTWEFLGLICKFPFNLNALLCESVNGRYYLIGAGTDSGKTFIAIYDLTEREFVCPRIPDGAYTLCTSERDGRRILFSLGGGWIRQRVLPNGEKIGETEAPGISFTRSAVVCDVGSQALLVCADGDSLHVFNAHTGQRLVDPIHAHSSEIQAVKPYMIGREAAILTGGWDGRVHFWNPRTWKTFFTIAVDYTIQDIHIDSDTLLIAGNRDVVTLDLNPQLLHSRMISLK